MEPEPIVQEAAVSPTETYVVTAYTLREQETGKRPSHPLYGITASGERVKAQETVACPRELPFGTRLDIEGVGERTCQDRGGAIKGRRIDVYIPELKVAREFGRQTLGVTIIHEKGSGLDE